MGKKRIIDLHFPTGGVDKKVGYQDQPPYMTPSAENVWPVATESGRERGASRPGLSKRYWNRLGGVSLGYEVRMLAEVSAIMETQRLSSAENFQAASLGSDWAVASWLGTLPTISEGWATTTSGTGCGVVRAALDLFSDTIYYYLELYVAPHLGSHKAKYQIFGRMDDTTPIATTDGFVAELVLIGEGGSPGAYSGTLKVYVNGVLTSYDFTPGTFAYATPGWFKILVNGNAVSCSWCATGDVGRILLAPVTLAQAKGKRFGFGMKAITPGYTPRAKTFRVQYKVTSNQELLRRLLVASAGGSLYRETYLGQVEQLSTSLTLAADRVIDGVERGQLLYIADQSDLRVQVTDAIVDATGKEITKEGQTWTGLGIREKDDVVVLSTVTGATVAGTYEIATVAADKLTLKTSAGGVGTAKVRVERGPKKYNPGGGKESESLVLWIATAAKGQVPTGCPCVCVYRDRLVLAGATAAPHAWYMSRQGDPLDWDYGADAEDAQRAVAGTLADAGQLGEPITAVIPHAADYLLFGCVNSLWLLRGDPAYGGQIDNLSRRAGIVDRRAWCRTPTGEIVFLCLDGIYVLAPGSAAEPQSVSRERLPKDLIYVDPRKYVVLMEYDVKHRGIHVYLTGKSGEDNLHYWFDWSSKSFWPMRLQTIHQPTAMVAYHSITAQEENHVLFGCRDGYLRCFDSAHEMDDASAISNFVFYGPVRVSGTSWHDGMVQELIPQMGEASGSAALTVHLGASHEAALAASPLLSAVVTGGVNYKLRPKLRGRSMFLKLANVSGVYRRWEVENMTFVLEQVGEARKL